MVHVKKAVTSNDWIKRVRSSYFFGMLMPDRHDEINGNPYTFGFIGAENNNEISGSGNAQDHLFRSYDLRLGHYKGLGPLARDYPWNSPYAYAENRVIDGFDLEGLEYISAHNFQRLRNANPTTDHFIAIVGRGSDTNGDFFRYYENVRDQTAGPELKLYCREIILYKLLMMAAVVPHTPSTAIFLQLHK